MKTHFFQTILDDSRMALREHTILFVFLLFLLFFQVYKIFHGVDVTDESYYFTVIIRMLQGDELFVNIWDGTQTSALLYIPFYWLYTTLFGFDGLILFGRLLSLVLRLFIILFGYYVFRDLFSKRALMLSLFLLLVITPSSIYTLGYNNSVFLLCILGVEFWFASLTRASSDGRRRFWLIIAGVTHAFMVACYPTALLLIPVMPICFFLVAHCIYLESKERVLKGLLWYALGAFFVLAFLVLYVILIATLDSTILSIKEFLSRPDSVTNNDKSGIGSYSLLDLKNIFFRKSALCMLLLLLVLIVAGIVGCKKRQLLPWIRKASVAFYAIWILFSIYLISSRSYGSASTLDLVLLLVVPLPCLLLSLVGTGRDSGLLTLFILIGCPSLVLTLVISVTSGGGFLQAKFALAGLSFFVYLCYSKAIQVYLSDSSFSDGMKHHFKDAGYCTLAFGLSALLFFQYCYPYRDVPVWEEDGLVEKGPGAGLYTSAENAAMLNQMKDDMDSVAVVGGHLLVVECYPYAYGLSELMSPAAPSTWLVSTRTGMGTTDYWWTNLFEWQAEFEVYPDVIFMDSYNRQQSFLDVPGADPVGTFDMNYQIHTYILANYCCVIYRDSYSLWVKK